MGKPEAETQTMWADHGRVGLILPGGGARCAYQVGVLKAIAQWLPRQAHNPFPVISGTSAGAINSVVLASRARRFGLGVKELERVWSGFRSEQVFRSDTGTVARSGLHWLTALVFGGLGARNPKSLLDNDPLRELLDRSINFGQIQHSIDDGYLDAVAVTAAGYGSARSVTFFQGNEASEPWERVRRIGRRADVTLDHLMGSVAVPMIFPPVQIGHEYFGDGAMRQATPLSPAVRLGADRLLVIGVRDEEQDPAPAMGQPVPYPSFGTIAGYVLDALFMDGLSSDMERLTRINLMLDELPGKELEGEFGTLRKIDAFVLLPSEDIREIALRHFKELPRAVRVLMRGLGAMNYGGRQLMSYLLFEAAYTQELIDLGHRDATARKDELLNFLQGSPVEEPGGISGWSDLVNEYTQKLRILNTFGQA